MLIPNRLSLNSHKADTGSLPGLGHHLPPGPVPSTEVKKQDSDLGHVERRDKLLSSHIETSRMKSINQSDCHATQSQLPWHLKALWKLPSGKGRAQLIPLLPSMPWFPLLDMAPFRFHPWCKRVDAICAFRSLVLSRAGLQPDHQGLNTGTGWPWTDS